jgi:hypothetical protein
MAFVFMYYTDVWKAGTKTSFLTLPHMRTKTPGLRGNAVASKFLDETKIRLVFEIFLKQKMFWLL